MSTLAGNHNLMLSTHDRIKLLEREQERLEGNVEFLIDEIEKLKNQECSCGGQNCGPTYKPEKEIT